MCSMRSLSGLSFSISFTISLYHFFSLLYYLFLSLLYYLFLSLLLNFVLFSSSLVLFYEQFAPLLFVSLYLKILQHKTIIKCKVYLIIVIKLAINIFIVPDIFYLCRKALTPYYRAHEVNYPC